MYTQILYHHNYSILIKELMSNFKSKVAFPISSSCLDQSVRLRGALGFFYVFVFIVWYCPHNSIFGHTRHVLIPLCSPFELVWHFQYFKLLPADILVSYPVQSGLAVYGPSKCFHICCFQYLSSFSGVGMCSNKIK